VGGGGQALFGDAVGDLAGWQLGLGRRTTRTGSPPPSAAFVDSQVEIDGPTTLSSCMAIDLSTNLD
jgi:hypothetical protein